MKIKWMIIFVFPLILLHCNNDSKFQAADYLYRQTDRLDRYKAALEILDEIPMQSLEYILNKDNIVKLKNAILDEYEKLKNLKEAKLKADIFNNYRKTKVAFVNDDASLYVMSLDNTTMVKIVDHRESQLFCKYPKWSPDGRSLVFESNSIYVVSSTGKDLKQVSNSSAGHEEFPSWSPDGRKIIYNYAEHAIISIDLQKKIQTKLYPTSELDQPLDFYPGFYPIYLTNNRDILFSRNGALQILEYGREEPYNFLTESNSASADPILNATGMSYAFPCLSHSGKSIAVEHQGLLVFDLQTRTAIKLFADGTYPSWSLDDKYLLINTMQDQIHAFYVVPVNRDPQFPELRIFLGKGRYASWSP